MDVRFFPRLEAPDWKEWERHFPNGVGWCAFSSPAIQRLMCQEMRPPWTLRWLCARTAEGQPLTVPVFARKGRWGRPEITVRPLSDYVGPIEGGDINSSMVETVLAAAQSPFTAGFSWWLPPWFAWPWTERPGRELGQLDVIFPEAYLIHLEGSVQDHYDRYVQKNRLGLIRATYRRGLEVTDQPTPAMIDEYHELYLRVWEEEKWIGNQHSRELFHGLATQLGEGGKMYLMTYQGKLVGGGILLYDHKAVHYFQGTIDRHVRGIFPHYVLYDLAFQQAEARGLRYINLGAVASDNEGLKFFKKSWGAEALPVPIIRWRYDGPRAVRQALKQVTNVAHLVRSLPLPHRRRPLPQ